MGAPENLKNLQQNLWTEINAMIRSKERSSEKIKRKTLQNWLERHSKWQDLLMCYFFKDNSE